MSDPFFKVSDFHNYFENGIKSCSAVQAAETANRLLQERGTVVYKSEAYAGIYNWHPESDMKDTHQALLINIEPIEKDSAEKIVDDFVKQVDHDFGMSSAWQSLVDRAKRLKGESK